MAHEAVKLYTVAAELGRVSVINDLGQMYDCGEFVKRDIQKAILCYVQAICAGNTQAQENLSRILMKENFKIDHFKQALLLLENAHLRNTDCIFIMYDKTLFFNKMADVKKAICRLGDNYYTGENGVSKDECRAVKLYEIAAEMNSANAATYEEQPQQKKVVSNPQPFDMHDDDDL